MSTSNSEIIREALQAQARLDPMVKTIIEEYSEEVEMTGAEFIENIIMDYGARMAAFGRAGMKLPASASPFLRDQQGRRVGGLELFCYLLKRYLAQFLRDKPQKRDKELAKVDKDYDHLIYQEIAAKYGRMA